MASDKDEANPFSYKAFISKREKGKEGEKKKKSSSKGSDTLRTDMPFPEASTDNPFSFKKFVKSNELLQKKSDSSFSSDDDDNNTLLSKHIQKEPSKNLKTSEPFSTEKDDLFSNNSDSDTEVTLQTLPKPLFSEDTIESALTVDDDDTIEFNPLDMNPFPEVAVLEIDESKHHLVAEIKQLKTENESLKKQLTSAEERLKKERTKSNSLREELKTLKEKEKKDTKALEDMVQKVEENLTTATQRSVQAEATISKLKQEIQTLKMQLNQANPQVIHKSYEDLVTGIRDKANQASYQLRTAAYKADLQIKELCQGVETLKFVSDLLENIDSIYEVKQ